MKGREVSMAARRQMTSISDFIKGYGYIVAFGLVAFGGFAIRFQEYDHPIYGHLDLGSHHVWIGVLSIVAGVAAGVYIRQRKKSG